MEFEARSRKLLPDLSREAHGVRFHVAATDAPATGAHALLAFTTSHE